MIRSLKWIASVATMLIFYAGAEMTAHPDDENPSDEIFNVGKSGEVKIGQDVTAGEVRVKRGKYLFEHRVHGERHMIVLTGVGKDASSGQASRLTWRRPYARRKVGQPRSTRRSTRCLRAQVADIHWNDLW